jgi:hypothetical protein
MPNDQAITYRLIPVIRAPGTCFRSTVLAWDDAGLHLAPIDDDHVIRGHEERAKSHPPRADEIRHDGP